MKRKLEFGVGIPTGTEGLMYPIPFVEDIRDNIRIAEKAEELGYDSVWGNDHIATQQYVVEDFGQAPNYFAPLITLAAIGEHTKHLKLATALLVLPFRQPGILAKELASLDRLCGGRLMLGVGMGAYQRSSRPCSAARPRARCGARWWTSPWRSSIACSPRTW